jgi:AcrR family transcriptional regulator
VREVPLSEDQRMLVAETARAQFLKAGYEATTLEMIAAASGLPATAVAAHFRSKQRLLEEVRDRQEQELADRIVAFFDTEADPLDATMGALCTLLAVVGTLGAPGEGADEPDRRSPGGVGGRAWFARLVRTIVARGVEGGAFRTRDQEALTHLVCGLLSGAVEFIADSPDRAQAERAARRNLVGMLAGMSL